MELGSESDHFKSLDQDLIMDIMSRLDGCTLAALASTCVFLWDATREDRLWQKICRDTWPSTSNRHLQVQVASSIQGSFKTLYADAFPLILYETSRDASKNIPTSLAINTASSSPWDFMSLVDINFKGNAIYSKVVDDTMESVYGTCQDNFKRFLCYPFKVDLLGIDSPKGSSYDFQILGSSEDNTSLPLDAFKGYGEREDISNKLLKDLRLSWILFDKRQGKAANISSWKARSIYRSNPSANGYVLCFGCIIPVEDNILTHPVAECVITAKCQLMIEQRCIKWKEITLVIKEIDGSHLNGEQSMAVMREASVCTRSINHYTVESGYKQVYKLKNELRLRDAQDESLANLLCAVAAIASLLGICYACATLL